MRHFRRYSILLWTLLRSIPPIRMEWLLASAVFLTVWTVFSFSGVDEKLAFVVSFVLAQMAQTWQGLPRAAQDERRRLGSGNGTRNAGIVIYLLFAVQIWCAEPWLSQRFLTVACALHFVMLVNGVRGNQWVLDTFVAVRKPTDVTMIARKHYLKLRALLAFLAIVVNETLMLIDAPLAARVVALALLPIALHVFFQMALFLTWPFEDDPAPRD